MADRIQPMGQHSDDSVHLAKRVATHQSTREERKEQKKENKKSFAGRWHFNGDLSYRRRKDEKHDIESGHVYGEEYEFKDRFGHISKNKNVGMETYLSRTRYKPRKLLVQASTHGHLEPPYDWHRRPISGSVPTALKISEWTLEPAFDASPDSQKRVRWSGIPLFMLRSLFVALPLQVYMSFPIFTPPWSIDDADDTYMDWPGRLWQWPKFAVNPLDMGPNSDERKKIRELSSRPRLLRPRLLVVREGDDWVVQEVENNPKAQIPYVMVSYTNAHFQTRTSASGRKALENIAEMEARDAGVSAYWLDFKCRAPDDNQTLLDSDVNRFCDVVRGARRVTIALPNDHPDTALAWGKRMWTLPEALLAPGEVYIHYVDTAPAGKHKTVVLSKVEIAAIMWNEPEKEQQGEGIQGTRLLAEHFSGVLQLSRLQLIATGLSALWDRKATVVPTPARPNPETELAHAMMGLLHTRIDPIESNSLFQDIAKLSLLNDSDRLVEKMVCLLYNNSVFNDTNLPGYRNPFGMLANPDDFGTHLWDIQPTCEVVGVDEKDVTVVLNDCRAIPIRWKQFPQMFYTRKPSFKKLFAELFLRSGAWWFVFGFSLTFTYIPFWVSSTGDGNSSLESTTGILDGLSEIGWLGLAVAFFFGIGALLSLAGPISLRILYGGVVMQCAPHLVGFEGAMPIGELEKIVFGNNAGRLSYEPSSSPTTLGYRDEKERIGTEPEWISDPANYKLTNLKPGYRLFTLVDTANMSITVFEAQRPPTVALICGREGGMLRTLLCSWNGAMDCLTKETVIRMPTDIYDLASAKGWLRLRLQR